MDRIDGVGRTDGGGISGTPIDTVVMAHNDPAALGISSGFIGFHIGSCGRLSCIVRSDDYIVLPIGNGSVANGNGILGRPPDTGGTAILDIRITAPHMSRMTDGYGIVGQSLAAPGQGHCCVSRSLAAAANGQGALSIGRGSVPHCQGIGIPIRRSTGIDSCSCLNPQRSAYSNETSCTGQKDGQAEDGCRTSNVGTRRIAGISLSEFRNNNISISRFIPYDFINVVHKEPHFLHLDTKVKKLVD